ncbi:hypothetical protein FH972_023839 [Carpinus fangiana]|uniref:Zn(2)-C6 fungal-type domain-containing protein n=1 Tax=Carpinus fangiana TaxID=176857 RepID=A0A5N6KWQ4_9ROSI|nr:hypothetical protein FH972_023839 [Carpinus fangiana]
MRHAGPRERLPRGRRAHHKVKTGCKACKVRHQKVCREDRVVALGGAPVVIRVQCDERSPNCSGCLRHSTECIYPDAEGRHLTTPSHLSLAPALDVIGSPQKALSVAPSPDLNLEDLELLHQYLTFTCVSTGQTREATTHLRNTGPRLGQTYPFVMRGLLAMAATHLSRLQPASQPHYAMMAARHQSASISDFRAAVPHLNHDNYQALIAYAKSLLWCAFATDEGSEGQGAPETNDWLPRWFWLLHGSCQIVESARPWIDSGPHALYKPDRRISDISPSPDDHHIKEIMDQTLLRIGPNALCSSVFSSLREAFARASMHHENTPLRNAMNTWAGSLPYSYIQSLHKEEPWALVALAAFCVLVDRSETVWFMKGHAKPLFISIVDRLNGTWRQCVEWPIQELGVSVK